MTIISHPAQYGSKRTLLTLRPLRQWESGHSWGRRVFDIRKYADRLLTNTTNNDFYPSRSSYFQRAPWAIGILVSLADFLRRRVVLYFEHQDRTKRLCD